ncbi:MAG: BMP family ABC transporter substrate-binding protein [Clostridiales bacterium]|nr:BMP family ABC transporter substrate-binding protein [Clostridiales bacterium]
MRKSWKIASALLLTALTGAALIGCGGSSETSQTEAAATEAAVTEAAADAGASAETEAAAAATDGEKIKLTLCIGRKNDLSFQQSAYEGTVRIEQELGDKYDVTVVEMGDETTKWEAAFYDAADSGADIIVGTGFQNKGNFETIPLDYPDTKFILFDQDVDYSIGGLDNVLTVLFQSNQSGYLAGAVAAYYTVGENAANEDRTIGFVGGTESTTIHEFLVGYAEGAKYVDPDIKILTAYVGDFMDTAKAKDLANAQISEGADIVFQVAGGAGNGVIEAAAEKDGVMAIGVDSDQYEALAGSNLQSAVITSSLKRLDNALFKICSDYAEDPSSVPFGTTATYGLEDDAVGIVFNDNLTQSIGEENVAKVEELLGKIQSGEIVVSEAGDLSAEEISAIVNQ